GQGIVVQFDDATYSDSIGFARVGDGSIGGKARGLSFMNNLLGRDGIYYKYPNLRILIPRSLVVATDYFDMFIKVNDLDYVISQDLSDELILHEFLNGVLPSGLYAKLKVFVMTCSKPLAIRSSSKLEDSNYQPFAGIYSTYMIPRCENDDQMLRLLVRAIKSVYASVYMSSAKAYIQSSQNVLGEEKMAVLIQEVCGSEENGYYFPTLAGVARSINSYPIGYEKPEDGVCNMVMGLGKAVVDGEKSFRFCPAYPDKALQTSTLELTLSEAQNEVLALNLNPHSFLPSVDDGINIVRLPISRIADYRNTKHTCSYYDFTNGRICESRPFDRFYKVITFNRILKYDSIPLAQVISDLLKIGEREMRTPVEIEFAVDMDVAPGTLPVFNLLQIRPIIANNEGGKIDWDKVNTEDAICYSNDALGIGLMKGLRKVIYVKFDKFSTLITQKIADELYTLNAGFEGEYILIGTGRWGSSIPSLGIPVKWQHISKARVIVESAIPGFNIEASQGSHFFQNVTSLGIGYVSLNPSAGDGILDIAALDAMPAIYDGEYLRCVEFDSDLFVCVDGKNKKAIIKKGDA
ncbi:MAG: phosphoenolpyruvate synthase, partial [Bacteroidales bacterium]|nr:phosphoenolpyruvate synthase [Bacteroidales bacterium]